MEKLSSIARVAHCSLQPRLQHHHFASLAPLLSAPNHQPRCSHGEPPTCVNSNAQRSRAVRPGHGTFGLRPKNCPSCAQRSSRRRSLRFCVFLQSAQYVGGVVPDGHDGPEGAPPPQGLGLGRDVAPVAPPPLPLRPAPVPSDHQAPAGPVYNSPQHADMPRAGAGAPSQAKTYGLFSDASGSSSGPADPADSPAAAASGSPSVPEFLFHHFKIVAELGSGSFGKVFMAKKGGTPYALKQTSVHTRDVESLERERKVHVDACRTHTPNSPPPIPTLTLLSKACAAIHPVFPHWHWR